MATYQSILITFFLSSYLTIFSQTIPKYNQIDSLNTEKEAFSFVKKHFPEFNGNETFEEYRNETQHIADSFKVRNWVKCDIDNNGETDLLIFRANKLPKIFAILSFHNNFVSTSATFSSCKYQFVYPVATFLNNQNIILLYSQDQVGYDRNSKHFIYTKIASDTLIVKETLFVNYTQAPKFNEIKTIEVYNDGSCEGNCPRIKINIDAKTFLSNCTKELYRDNKLKSYTGQLTKEQIRHIVKLLDYSNFSELKEKYGYDCIDSPTTTITVKYENGYTKTVDDQGSWGNFTLAEIYKIAFGIKWIENKGN
jgi:hypothetical protein